MVETEAFKHLVQSFSDFTSHWKFTSFMAFVSSLFGYLIGFENRELLVILMLLGSVDWILGSTLAIKERQFSKSGMAKGIYKVIFYGCFLIFFHIAEAIIDGTVEPKVEIIDIAAYFYLILRESKSINEHLASANLPLPFNPFLWIEKRLNTIADSFEKTPPSGQNS